MRGAFHRFVWVVCVALSLLAVPRPVLAVNRYVSLSCTNPVSPYTNWVTAATNIQDAVNAAMAGETVVVTDGVYSSGSTFAGDQANRIAVTNGALVESVNGPAFTSIVGEGPVGPAAVRCAYVGDGSRLAGFTLTNGCSGVFGYGGGVYCDSRQGQVSNCMLTGNSAHVGGGAAHGTLYKCTLTGNLSMEDGAGAFNAALSNCMLIGNTSLGGAGGGAALSILNNCTLEANSAIEGGGAALLSDLVTCTLIGNSAVNCGGGVSGGSCLNCTFSGNWAYDGGGAMEASLYNCKLTGNSASGGSGGGSCGGSLYDSTITGNAASNGSGGGVHGGTLLNCIVTYNAAAEGTNYDSASSLSYCCTLPLPDTGTGNITNDPWFVEYGAGDLHLSPSSACVNAGSNSGTHVPVDMDLDVRIQQGVVDMGAYESPYLPPAWLLQYELPADGSTTFEDGDKDGYNNSEEYLADTNPTNDASFFPRLTNLTGSAVFAIDVAPTSTGRVYDVYWRTDLMPETSAWNASGERQWGTGSNLVFVITNVPSVGFYRTGVMMP